MGENMAVVRGQEEESSGASAHSPRKGLFQIIACARWLSGHVKRSAVVQLPRTQQPDW